MTLPTRAVTVPSPAEQSRQACALPRRALGSRRVLAWEIDPTIQPLRAADTDHTNGSTSYAGYPAWPVSGVPTGGFPQPAG